MSFVQRPATAHRPPATNQVSGNSSPRFCVTVHEAERTGTYEQIFSAYLKVLEMWPHCDERFYFAYGLPGFHCGRSSALAIAFRRRRKKSLNLAAAEGSQGCFRSSSGV